jgi:hypothetical protein
VYTQAAAGHPPECEVARRLKRVGGSAGAWAIPAASTPAGDADRWASGVEAVVEAAVADDSEALRLVVSILRRRAEEAAEEASGGAAPAPGRGPAGVRYELSYDADIRPLADHGPAEAGAKTLHEAVATLRRAWADAEAGGGPGVSELELARLLSAPAPGRSRWPRRSP